MQTPQKAVFFSFIVFFLFFSFFAFQSNALETSDLGKQKKITPLKITEDDNVHYDFLRDECRMLLPGFAYSEKQGSYPHYRAYKYDPITQENVTFAFCFLSTDVVPRDDILQPMQILIVLDIEGVVFDFKIIEESEYRLYLLLNLAWEYQLKQKSLQDPWEYDNDIERLDYPYWYTHVEEKAHTLIEQIHEPSKRIANLYLTEEVKQKAKEYSLHLSQFEHLSEAQIQEKQNAFFKRPSQDYILQEVMDSKLQELSDHDFHKKPIYVSEKSEEESRNNEDNSEIVALGETLAYHSLSPQQKEKMMFLLFTGFSVLIISLLIVCLVKFA